MSPPRFTRTPVTGFRATLLQYDFILANYNCEDPSSKYGRIVRSHVYTAFEGVLPSLHERCYHSPCVGEDTVPREAEQLVQGCTATKWPSQD